MPSDLPDPCPGNWNRAFSVGQADDQQLMDKTNFGPIYDQPDLLKMASLTYQPASCDRIVPGMHINCWIGQKPAQALNKTEQLSLSRHLSGDLIEINRPALMNSNHQPGKIPDTSNSFGRLQLSNCPKPSMIEIVDRHGILLFFGRAKIRSTFIVPINPF